jgi:hypothetical protein
MEKVQGGRHFQISRAIFTEMKRRRPVDVADASLENEVIEKLTGATNDALYLVDSNLIELCDLGLRHPVFR